MAELGNRVPGCSRFVVPDHATVGGMQTAIKQIVDSYDRDAPLERASTIPASWYLSPDVMELEQRTVFARSWQVVGRAEQVDAPGRYVSCVLPSGEPIVVIRGRDSKLRGFFNV